VDHALLANVTLVVPFYRNVGMLRRQVEEWAQYSRRVRVIVVDDGSPEPALPILEAALIGTKGWAGPRVHLYRITVDIPWNREGARNLATQQVETDWVLHVDIDHVLPAASAAHLLKLPLDPSRWYRFPRYRVGRADDTRQKDKIDPLEPFGEIHPHIDSHLMTRELYHRAGGYDEDYAGVLGGGSDFLRRVEAIAPVAMLPPEVCLHVYTRDKIPDASDWSLSRDRGPGKDLQRKKAAQGSRGRPRAPLRFPWVQQL
jgi:glycosyltransferase involved in cell wall biosynthesis